MIVVADVAREDRKRIEAWCSKPIPAAGERHWGEALPAAVKEVMLRFPPSCVVRAKRELIIPSPGRYGVVTSYLETRGGRVDLAVADLESLLRPGEKDRSHCEADWLEVVAYRGFLTPDYVRLKIGN